MERFLGQFFLPRLIEIGYGERQFAYTPERGVRGVRLLCIVTWLSAVARGHAIAVYCADVSGAFDRVPADRLCGKLAAAGVGRALLRVLA
eukprot:4913972-Alexandrium_andersonii.AAC.1